MMDMMCEKCGSEKKEGLKKAIRELENAGMSAKDILGLKGKLDSLVKQHVVEVVDGMQSKFILRKLYEKELPWFIVMRPKAAFNAGTGVGSNGPDHGAELYINKIYPEDVYKEDVKRYETIIAKYNLDRKRKAEIYLLRKLEDYGYVLYDKEGRPIALKIVGADQRPAANAKNKPHQKTFEIE